MMLRAGLGVLAAFSLSACAAPPESIEHPAAVIVAPNAASRATLQQAVSKLVGRPVTLADDALTRESTLTIERTGARDPSGRRIEVRETTMPESLRLVQRGAACVLIHDATKQEIMLNGVSCKAQTP